MGADHSAGVVRDQKARVGHRHYIACQIEVDVGPPTYGATHVVDKSSKSAGGNVGCSHVDCSIQADGASWIYDRREEITSSRNVICGDVHRGVRAGCSAAI